MSLLIPKPIKKILKPFARAAASVIVWILLFISYYLFKGKKSCISTLIASLCLNDLLVFKMDPKKIQYHIKDPDKMQDGLFVWGGDWDQDIIDIEEHEKLNMVRELIVDKKDYDDTRFYSYAMKQIRTGKPLSRGNIRLDSREKIVMYFKKQERLFEDIKANGFDPGLASETGVAVARDGRLIHYRQGHHTLAIAKILGVEKVIVRIRAVHKLWLLEQIKDSGLSVLAPLRKGLQALEKQSDQT